MLEAEKGAAHEEEGVDDNLSNGDLVIIVQITGDLAGRIDGVHFVGEERDVFKGKRYWG